MSTAPVTTQPNQQVLDVGENTECWGSLALGSNTGLEEILYTPACRVTPGSPGCPKRSRKSSTPTSKIILNGSLTTAAGRFLSTTNPAVIS